MNTKTFKFFLISTFCSLLCWANAFAQYGIWINDGQEHINKREVSLRILGEGMEEMMLCNEYIFAGSAWQPVQEKIDWVLDEGDGLKTVCIKFRDKDGNESGYIFDEIMLDTQAPFGGSLLLAGGNTYITHYMNVGMEIAAYEADEMFVSTDENFSTGRWLPFNSQFTTNLSSGDGEKKVYVKFRDKAGNVSETTSDAVILDTTPPSDLRLEIISDDIILDETTGKKYLNQVNSKVDLEAFAKGAEYMKITNVFSDYGLKWRMVDDYYEDWPLDNPRDGVYYVYAQFRDVAGNHSRIVKDEVIVDTYPPVAPNVAIENDEKFATGESVELDLFALEATEMMISDDPKMLGAEWQPFQRQATWNFEEGDGEKRIFVKYRDIAHNETPVVSDEVLIDRLAPQNCSISLQHGDEVIDDQFVIVDLNADDALMMKVSEDPTFYQVPWQYYKAEPFVFTLNRDPGHKKVYVTFKDEAGNQTDIYEDSIIINAPPVRYQLAIDRAAKYCTDPEGKTMLYIHSREASEMMVSNLKHFDDADWEPYVREKPWQLEPGVGEKEVFIKFRSAIGTESPRISSKIILDNEAPQNIALSVNKGKSETLLYHTKVMVKAENAEFMQISNRPDFLEAPWQRYTMEPVSLKLVPQSGDIRIYARCKDLAGNISDTVSVPLTVGLMPLRAKISIDKDAIYSHSKELKVKLDLYAQDATEMMVSNNSSFRGAEWEPYQEQKDWELTDVDGKKTVFVKFRSRTKTECRPVSDDIILDIHPPQKPSITLANGKPTTKDYYVWSELKAADAVLMKVSLFEDMHDARWQAYTHKPYLTFLGTKGDMTAVYAQFQDVSGNITDVVSDSIFVEVTPNQCKISINNNDPYTTNRESKVSLLLKSDNVDKMMISNNSDFAGAEWEPYHIKKEWVLTPNDGEKVVYAKFISKTGTESKVVKDKILIDTKAPFDCAMEVSSSRWWERLNPNYIQVKVKAKDAVLMQLSENGEFNRVRWLPYTDVPFTYRVTHGDGVKKLYARFKDLYGNVSEVVSGSVNIDKLPPQNNSLVINDGKAFTNSEHVKLHLYSEDAAMVRISNTLPSIKTARWVKYEEEIDWKLTNSEDNIKHVYIQFKDATGNVTKPVEVKVELDRKPPLDAIMTIEGGSYCHNPNGLVMLNLKSEGATRVMLSNSNNFEGKSWKKLTPKMEWQLEGPDGDKVIYARFSDESGNEPDMASVSVLLDRKAPEGNDFTINKGAEFTNSANVELSLESIGAHEMVISNTGLFAIPEKWEPFKKTRKWNLNHLEGKKTVFVKFRDRAGNVTEVLTQSIILDSESPVVHTFKINGDETMVDGLQVSLDFHLKDAPYNEMPDAKFMQIANSPNGLESAEWQPLFNGANWNIGGTGLQKVYVRFKDVAGNVTRPFAAQITVY
ncbi:hypothetical protein R9C00_16590 [Flammeovirgaceae bacterium SG7u.111]|nr:hypothetical protein [Flammeovirgaceae bacterium SG7u.132]WPO33321.1 hypothetical protein R9C00_16590 [Flammeovirgaceae bacterium SG7u.111]